MPYTETTSNPSEGETISTGSYYVRQYYDDIWLEYPYYSAVFYLDGVFAGFAGMNEDENFVQFTAYFTVEKSYTWRMDIYNDVTKEWQTGTTHNFTVDDTVPTPVVHLIFPEDEETEVGVNTNFQINISSGVVQKVQLYLNGDLEQEWEVGIWQDFHWLNPTNDLEEDTEYSWYVKVQDWNDPYDWYQSDETWTFTTGTESDPPGKAQNPTPEHEEEDVQIVGRNTLAKLEWEAPD